MKLISAVKLSEIFDSKFTDALSTIESKFLNLFKISILELFSKKNNF